VIDRTLIGRQLSGDGARRLLRESLGRDLRRLREDLELSTPDVAKGSRFVSERSIRYLEAGQRAAQFENVVFVAAALGYGVRLVPFRKMVREAGALAELRASLASLAVDGPGGLERLIQAARSYVAVAPEVTSLEPDRQEQGATQAGMQEGDTAA
jgi:hypothetical protein